MENERLLTVGDVAEWHGVKPVTVRMWHHRGILVPAVPAYTAGNREHRYTREQVASFVPPSRTSHIKIPQSL